MPRGYLVDEAYLPVVTKHLRKEGVTMKIKLWDRIERGMEKGFDEALAAVHSIR